MEPEYVARKSKWKAVTFWRVVFFWLIIPLIVMIVGMIRQEHEIIEFYRDKIVVKSGVLSKNERQSVFSGVLSVSISQTFAGRIFHYGNVKVDAVGKWDINTTYVKNPRELKEYLETRIVTPPAPSTTVMHA